MNALVVYLRTRGHLGAGNAIRRKDLADALNVSIRSIRVLAEEARNAGEFVSYSTDSEKGGLFLASTDDEKVSIVAQIRSTCQNRLRQYSALKRALLDRHQRHLFPETPDQVFQRSIL
jgi:hypothetical protein